MIGERFGLLVVTKRLLPIDRASYWECQCDCGSVVQRRRFQIIASPKASCGCATFANRSKAKTKHGNTPRSGRTPEWTAWRGLKARCLNPRHADYGLYGGRGIAVCARWLDSFENFLADMGPRPSNKHSIDRIDPDGNYEPSNCRWATWPEQRRNQRRMRKVGK